MTEEKKTKEELSSDLPPTKEDNEFKKLLASKNYMDVPSPGDITKGTVLSVSKREIRIDIPGFRTGIVRGRELSADPALLELKEGEEIEATIVELENENGEMELSLRSAGQKKAWDNIKEAKDKKEAVIIHITEANKGGLIGVFEGVQGFLPVSQLSPEKYPRVSGGDKSKILEKLRSFIGQKMNVKILDADEDEQKLIFSEKNLWEEEQRSEIEKYKVGDVVEGEISALAEFGAFVKFNDLEGLIHISEIAWQRIDHPGDLLKVGQKIKAQIVGIEGSKIFLSIKKLEDDPWNEIAKKYKVGQTVKGKVLKINPFGFFVELDDEIHGLAHVSELGLTAGQRPEDIAKPEDIVEFKIISIEPEYHRLGLSLKAMKKSEEKKTEKKSPNNTEDEKDEKKEEKVTSTEIPEVPLEKAPDTPSDSPEEPAEEKEEMKKGTTEKELVEEKTKEEPEEPKEEPTEEK